MKQQQQQQSELKAKSNKITNNKFQDIDKSNTTTKWTQKKCWTANGKTEQRTPNVRVSKVSAEQKAARELAFMDTGGLVAFGKHSMRGGAWGRRQLRHAVEQSVDWRGDGDGIGDGVGDSAGAAAAVAATVLLLLLLVMVG